LPTALNLAGLNDPGDVPEHQLSRFGEVAVLCHELKNPSRLSAGKGRAAYRRIAEVRLRVPAENRPTLI
jgi:hypothetical protein